MTHRQLLALAIALIPLALPATAAGHAWSDTHTLAPNSTGHPVIDMAPTGHAIVGWSVPGGNGHVAIASPGGALGAPVSLATSGASIQDVAIAENGDAFAVWRDQNGLHVATRSAGGTWGGGQQLPGVEDWARWDLVAGEDGDATVVAATEAALVTFTRAAGQSTFATGPTSSEGYGGAVNAGYVGDVVLIAQVVAGAGVYTRTLDGTTLSEPEQIDTITGPPNGRLSTDRGGTGAVLVWPAYGGPSGSHMRAARAGADGDFSDGADISGGLYKGVLYPAAAIGADGRTLMTWGDAEFDPVKLVLASSPTTPFEPTAIPPIPGNRTDEMQLAFDSTGAQLAGWYFSDRSSNGSSGRIEIATRLAGQDTWCRAETLASQRAFAHTLRVVTDALGNGFAIWHQAASGPDAPAPLWVSRYQARDDCPPAPPAPPAEVVQQEEVVYLPPPPPPPVVQTVRRFVTLPSRASVDRRGRVRIPVMCGGTASTCGGRLALKRGRATWASRTFTIAKGRKTITLRLKRKARRSLARKRRQRVTAEVRLTGEPVKRDRLTLRRR